MKHTLHFNYNIGDKVILKMMPYYLYQASGSWKYEFKPKEYEISGLGWELDEKGYHTYYRLYAYCDEYLTYHNKISDTDIIKPSGEVHPIDIEFDLSDGNGDEIKIGDNIIAYVVHKWNGETEINYRFDFAGEGIVTKLASFYDGTKYMDGKYHISGKNIDVYYKRYFNCKHRDGSEYKDGRREGEIDSNFICNCYKKLPDNYIEDYVKACIEHKFNPCAKPDRYDEFDIWLEHFGIFEEVKRLYKEKTEVKKATRKPSTKKTVKKTDKLNKLVEGLSDKEKEELLKVLQKRYQ